MVSNVHPKKPDSARVDELNKVRELSATWTTIYPAGLIVVIVSLHNRKAERRGRQNACVWQTWHGYYLRVLLCSLLPINAFWSFTIGSVKKRVKIGGTLFKTKLLSRLSHKVCRLLPLPFCFAISRIYLMSFNKLEDFGESLPFLHFLLMWNKLWVLRN